MCPSSTRTRFPLVAAHRGPSRVAPENTLSAFRKAWEAGVLAVELDVQRTQDQQIVVMHDLTVDRTTNGHGLVRDMTWPQLRTLDAGSWFNGLFADERIPLLEEVLEWAKGRLFVNIELKPSALQEEGLEERAAAIVREANMESEVVFMSFDHLAIQRVKRYAPQIPGLVIYSGRLVDEMGYVKAMGADGMNHASLWWTAEDMKAAHDADLIVHCSGIDSPEEWERMVQYGADMVDSDDPVALMRVAHS